MLAQIPDLQTRAISFALVVCAAGALTSCATKEAAPLVADPTGGGRESTLPWNKQEKWEQAGVPGLTDRPH